MSNNAQKKTDGSGQKEVCPSDPSAHPSKPPLSFRDILGSKQIPFGATSFTFEADSTGGRSPCD